MIVTHTRIETVGPTEALSDGQRVFVCESPQLTPLDSEHYDYEPFATVFAQGARLALQPIALVLLEVVCIVVAVVCASAAGAGWVLGQVGARVARRSQVLSYGADAIARLPSRSTAQTLEATATVVQEPHT